jgi:dipeptidase E
MTRTWNVVAGGGGSASAEADVLAYFSGLVGRSGRILDVPWAQPDPTDPALSSWARLALGEHGITQVDTMTSVEAVGERLDAYDGVFMGGGNTFLLLERLRATGFGVELARAVRAGLPCYGGSAGAIVLGVSIEPCLHLDRNDLGMTDLAGLDLFGGRAVWCHYHAGDRALIERFCRARHIEVLAVPENAGAAFDSCTLRSLGAGVVDVWASDGRAYPLRHPRT